MNYNITTIITSYNQVEYIEKAIDSVVNQTYPVSQVIVIDDLSTDGTFERVKGKQGQFPNLISVFRMEKNSGASICRNKGIEEATGDWISILDGDDFLETEKVAKEVEVLDSDRKIEIVYSDFCFTDHDGNSLSLWNSQQESLPSGDILGPVFGREFPGKTLFRNELVRKTVYEKSGFFDPELKLYEDFDLKIRQSAVAEIAHCPNVGSNYRLHEQGLSRAAPTGHLQALAYVFGKNQQLLENLNHNQLQNALRRFRKHQLDITQNQVIGDLKKARYFSTIGWLKQALEFRLLMLFNR